MEGGLTSRVFNIRSSKNELLPRLLYNKIMIPTEKEEQIALRQYLDLKGWPYFRVPNETFTRSWNQKRLNKVLGVKAGVPDMFVLVGGRVVAIEMKRTKGGVTSPHQKYWLVKLTEHGIESRVCKGAYEAIAWLESLDKATDGVPQSGTDYQAVANNSDY